jgi:hypothetical protein
MSVQLSAVTTTSSVKIKQRVGLLLFKIVALGTTTAATALARANAVNIEIKRLNSNGEKAIFPIGSLMKTAEMNAHLLSPVILSNDGTDTTVSCSLLLVDNLSGGSIAFNENEELKVEVSAIGANTNVSMNSIELPGQAKYAIVRDYVNVDANVKTPVNVAGAKLLGMNSSTLISVELEFPDGKMITLTPDEIKDLQDNHKPLAYLQNGLGTPGGILLHIIDVDQAIRANITASGSGGVELLKIMPL